MKKLFIIIIVLVSLHFITRYTLGFSIYRIGDALQVSASLGAKIACSARYVSGMTEQQVVEDLASYSPVTRLLDIQYDASAKSAMATMLNMASYSATFRKGLGCSLDIGDTAPLNSLKIPEIAPGDAPWPAGNSVNSIDANYQSLTEQMLTKDNQNGLQSRAILVIKGDNIVAESYASGITADTQLLGWSMGKSLTAIMLGRMVEMGIADLDSPTGLEQWQDDERKDITVMQLLQMTSGLEFDETYAPGSDSTRMLFTEHSASEVALEATSGARPGEHFSYSSGTTNILMRWMRDRLGSNQALVDFFYNEILKPAAMNHTTFEVDPGGVFVGSSYLFATARDWGRLGLLMLQNGQLNGKTLLTEAWVTAAQTYNHSNNYRKYGYQFWLNSEPGDIRWEQLPSDAYMMMGNRKQVVMIIPSEDLVIVRLGWTSGHYPTEANFARIVNLPKSDK